VSGFLAFVSWLLCGRGGVGVWFGRRDEGRGGLRGLRGEIMGMRGKGMMGISS